MLKKFILAAAFSLAVLCAQAVLKDAWNADIDAFSSHTVKMYRGETVELSVTFVKGNRLVSFPPRARAAFLWQTNGMDTAWWTASAAIAGSTAKVDFTPGMDPGIVEEVPFYFYVDTNGAANYRATGRISFLPSPCGDGTALPWPTKVLDFTNIRVVNDPWTPRIDSNETAIAELYQEVLILSNEVAEIIIPPPAPTGGAYSVSLKTIVPTSSFVSNVANTVASGTNVIVSVVSNAVFASFELDDCAVNVAVLSNDYSSSFLLPPKVQGTSRRLWLSAVCSDDPPQILFSGPEGEDVSFVSDHDSGAYSLLPSAGLNFYSFFEVSEGVFFISRSGLR